MDSYRFFRLGSIGFLKIPVDPISIPVYFYRNSNAFLWLRCHYFGLLQNETNPGSSALNLWDSWDSLVSCTTHSNCCNTSIDFHEFPQNSYRCLFVWIPMQLSWIPMAFVWNTLIHDCISKHLLFPASATQDKAAMKRNVNRPVHRTGSGLVLDWWGHRHMEKSD